MRGHRSWLPAQHIPFHPTELPPSQQSVKEEISVLALLPCCLPNTSLLLPASPPAASLYPHSR